MSSLLTEPTVAVLIVAGHVPPFDAVRWARIEGDLEAPVSVLHVSAEDSPEHTPREARRPTEYQVRPARRLVNATCAPTIADAVGAPLTRVVVVRGLVRSESALCGRGSNATRSDGAIPGAAMGWLL